MQSKAIRFLVPAFFGCVSLLHFLTLSMISFLNKLTNKTFLILIVLILIPAIVILFINDGNNYLPQYINFIAYFVLTISLYYITTRMSKNFYTSSLVELWYKNSLGLFYLNDLIQSTDLEISQSAMTSKAEFEKMNSELEAIIKDSNEKNKLVKIKNNISYRKPEDIFEAISDCYRYSIEFKRMINTKKYSLVFRQSYIDTTSNFIISLKEVYHNAAKGTNKFIPKWVSE